MHRYMLALDEERVYAIPMNAVYGRDFVISRDL
jgi:hypothetical protein